MALPITTNKKIIVSPVSKSRRFCAPVVEKGGLVLAFNPRSGTELSVVPEDIFYYETGVKLAVPVGIAVDFYQLTQPGMKFVLRTTIFGGLSADGSEMVIRCQNENRQSLSITPHTTRIIRAVARNTNGDDDDIEFKIES